MTGMTRRQLLGVAACTVLAGWDPGRRRWITADAATTCPTPTFDGIPSLDGVLLQDSASRQLAADDYGHIVHQLPGAVLRPGSVQDVVAMVRFAAARRIPVTMRGQGGSTYGQAQVAEGLVIDSTTLSEITWIGADRAAVQPGVLWRALLLATAAYNLMPPVNTDYQDLTVGGTLSLGGLDSGPMLHGAQVDNVLELRAVTGAGELVTCSRETRPDLFHAVLGGLGQCALIVGATIRLVPAPSASLLIHLHYDDLDACLRDTAMLARDQRFNAFEAIGNWQVDHWTFEVQAVCFDPPDPLDTTTPFANLHDNPALRAITPIPYLSWHSRYDALLTGGRAGGFVGGATAGSVVIFNALLPADSGREWLKKLFTSALVSEIGAAGRVFLLATNSRHITTPLLQVPGGVGYAVLLARVSTSPAQTNTFLAANRQLFDSVTALGGKRYPWDAIPQFGQQDWITHFGDDWRALARAKRRYDPSNVLGRGLDMFPHRPCSAQAP